MNVQSMAKGALSALLGQWGKYAVQIVSLMVFSRLLTPEDFGLVAMVTAVIGIAWVIGDFGLSLAAIQAQFLSHEQKSNLFWANTGVGVVLSIAIVALARPLASFYGDDRLAPIATAIAIVFTLNGLGTQFKAEINRGFRFQYLALVDVISQTVAFVIALVLVLTTDITYWALVVQQISAAVLALAMVGAGAHWRPGLPNRNVDMRSLYSFGILTFAAQIITYVTSNLDSVLIGKVNGATTIGHYNRAYQVAAMPVQQMASPLTRVIVPHLSMRLEKPKAYARSLRNIQLVLSYALIGALSYLATATYPLVDIVLGTNWEDAVPMIRMLTIGSALQALGYIYYWVMLSRARTGLLLVSELPGRILMVVLMIAVSPLGPLWVAGAIAVGQLSNLIVGAVYALPKLDLKSWPVLASSIRPLALFLFATAVALPLDALVYAQLPIFLRLVCATLTWLAATAALLVFARYRADLRLMVRAATQVMLRQV